MKQRSIQQQVSIINSIETYLHREENSLCPDEEAMKDAERDLMTAQADLEAMRRLEHMDEWD